MQKIGLIFIAILILVTNVSLARSQDKVSAESTALVKELIEVTGGKKQFDDIMTGIISVQRDQSAEMLNELFKNDKGIRPTDKKILADMVAESVERITVKAQDFFTTKFDFDKFISDVFVPAYTKHFTDDELRDLIKFYHTPTGQKATREMPQMMTETTVAVTKNILPALMEFLTKAVDQETAGIKQKFLKKKG